MQEPRWISKKAVLAIHSEQLLEHGGSGGIRDQGLLDSALTKPLNVFNYSKEPDIFWLAASYAFGIIRNHPFLDGNKRAGLVVSLTFLARHGWRIEAPKEEIYVTFLHLADGTLGEAGLAKWFAGHAVSF